MRTSRYLLAALAMGTLLAAGCSHPKPTATNPQAETPKACKTTDYAVSGMDLASTTTKVGVKNQVMIGIERRGDCDAPKFTLSLTDNDKEFFRKDIEKPGLRNALVNDWTPDKAGQHRLKVQIMLPEDANQADNAKEMMVSVLSGAQATGTPTGLANPASVNCIDKGGKLEIRTDATGGQVGYCKFKNNKECEEWAFFRGECKN